MRFAIALLLLTPLAATDLSSWGRFSTCRADESNGGPETSPTWLSDFDQAVAAANKTAQPIFIVLSCPH
jgi:hypothetical protein